MTYGDFYLTRETWKDLIEGTGMIAIIASLVLVAYEVRQNTLMMRAQTRDSLTEKQMTMTSWISTNEFAANLIPLGARGELEPGSPESIAFDQLLTGMMREWENSLYQYEQGLFDASEFNARMQAWSGFVTQPGVRSFWTRRKENFSPNFRSEIERIIADSE